MSTILIRISWSGYFSVPEDDLLSLEVQDSSIKDTLIVEILSSASLSCGYPPIMALSARKLVMYPVVVSIEKRP